MTFIELLAKFAKLSGDELIHALAMIGATYPDLKAGIDKWIEALQTPLPLAEIQAELGNIAKGQLDGRKHPSDIA